MFFYYMKLIIRLFILVVLLVMSTAVDYCFEDSDDESPNRLYAKSGPPNHIIVNLFNQINKNGVLELEWKRPVTVSSGDMVFAVDQNNMYNNNGNSMQKVDQKPELSAFDFNDDMTDDAQGLPLRPRTVMRPKTDQNQKSGSQLDKIFNDFITKKGDSQQQGRQLLIPSPKLDNKVNVNNGQPAPGQVNVSHVVVTQQGGGMLGVPIAIQQKPLDPNMQNHQLQTLVQQFGNNQQQMRQGIPANHFILDQRQTLEQFFQQPSGQHNQMQVGGSNQRGPTHVVHLIQHPQLQQFIQTRPGQQQQPGMPNIVQHIQQGQPGSATQLQVSLAQLQHAQVHVSAPHTQTSTTS